MKIVIKKTYQELSKKGAQIIKKEIQSRPVFVLGLTSGSTPEGCYKELVRFHCYS